MGWMPLLPSWAWQPAADPEGATREVSFMHILGVSEWEAHSLRF